MFVYLLRQLVLCEYLWRGDWLNFVFVLKISKMPFLTLKSIFGFAKSTLDSRNFCEGEEVLFAKHVVVCGVLPDLDNYSIYSLVLQTSALSSPPHVVTGLIQKKDLSIKRFSCSCKAGASECCKHVMAVLLYCHRTDMDSLEALSTTDKKCLWAQLKGSALQKYQVSQPVSTFCCYKPRSLVKVNVNLTDVYERAVKSLPLSALAKHSQLSKNIDTGNESDFGNVDFIDNNIKNLCYDVNADTSLLYNLTKDCMIAEPKRCCREFYITNVVLYNSSELCERTLKKEEWNKERRLRITGSRCYQIYTYRGEDWVVKRRMLFTPKPFSNKYVEHGLLYEDVARKAYEAAFEVQVLQYGLLVPECEPWLGYSPDGIAGEKLIEIKCPYEGTNNSISDLLPLCSFLVLSGNQYQLKKKHPYYGQITLGMVITNRKQCDFIVYASKDNSFFVETVELDLSFAHSLLIKLKERYFNNLLPQFCTVCK